MPPTEMHECKGCGHELAKPWPFCLVCKSALRKQGLCCWCGEKPADGKSQYCREHRAIAADHGKDKHAYGWTGHSHRSQEAKEKTYETKHGTGHG